VAQAHNLNTVGDRCAETFLTLPVEIHLGPSRSCPGIAGWAQIHGYRGETDAEEKMRKRVEYHLFYIDNWPLCLDLQIEARTPLSRTAYQNAYCPANRKRVIPAHAGIPINANVIAE